MFKKTENMLGIDISPSAVKLVELSRGGRRFQVEAMAMEPLPEGVMADRNPNDPEEVGAAIKRALKSSGSKLKKAAVAVPTSSVITRTIPMPAEFGEDDIESSLQFEAAQYIPFPLEEIYLDFQVLASSKSGADTQDIMLVASRRENVDLREETLREAGLKPMLIDVEAYALENTFSLLIDAQGKGDKKPLLSKGDQGKRIAVVDMGASITTLYVFQGDRVIFTREQPFGGEQLTAIVADTYDLPKDRAELAKRSGDLSEDYPTAILEPFKQSAAEQVGNALQFFFSSSQYNSVDSIILVGGGGMIAKLDEAVTELLGIPTTIGNPFAQMGNAGRVNRHSLLRDAPLFAVACGLALRSFG